LGAAIFISEYAPRRIGDLISFAIEMLVAIPSVVYGLWGVKILGPLLGNQVEPFLQNTLGQIPIIGGLFANTPSGNDYLTASLILTIMILPTILAISREVVRQVPKLQKEGMIALGATKWEAIRLAILPYARAGITGGAMLGLARAIGETLAVTMTIGNNPQFLGPSLFNAGYTLASGIANRVNESESIGYNALIELGLLLLLVSLIINLLSRLLVSRSVKL
jgi:phosphate transport system permease protein